jgi:hypothetical protein
LAPRIDKAAFRREYLRNQQVLNNVRPGRMPSHAIKVTADVWPFKFSARPWEVCQEEADEIFAPSFQHGRSEFEEITPNGKVIAVCADFYAGMKVTTVLTPFNLSYVL